MAPLERDVELELISGAVEAATEGHGGVVVLEGPAGIGKSALLDEARRRASGSVAMLGARGGALERAFGFGIVRQLLEVPARGRDLPEAARAVLTDQVADAGALPVDAGFTALHGLFWTVLDLAAERPLLLAVDDVQWADRPSLRLLAYLSRRLEELPVLLMVTYRTGEPDIDEDLVDAIRDPPARIVVPGPLGSAGVGQLLRERLGVEAEPAFVAACRSATGGNPLLVRELAAALADDGVRPVATTAGVVRAIGPRAVSRTVAARLARQTADEVAVARAVAVLGDGTAVGDAARFAGLSEERVAAATGPLARGEILRPEPPLGFVHPLVADAVLLTLAPGERELQHARAARMLQERGAPAEQVAGHLVRAPRDGEPWVVEVLRDAARTAVRRGAAESAAAYLLRALDEPAAAAGPERGAMLVETGLVEAMASGPGAVEHLREALTIVTDPAERALAASILGRSLLFTDDAVGASEVVDEVAAGLGEEHPDLRDQLTALSRMAAWLGERAPTVAASTEGARSLGPGATLGQKMVAAVACVSWANVPGPRDACLALAHAALAGDEITAVDNGVLNVPPILPLGWGEDPTALAYVERWLADAQESGSLFAVAALRLWLAAVQLWRGELEEAEATVRQAGADMRVWGFELVGPDFGTAVLVKTLVDRGDLVAARTALEAAPAIADAVAEGVRFGLEAKLALLLAERRDTEAAGVAALLAERFGHARNPATSTWRLARAELRHRAGDAAGAAADVEEQLGLARTWGAPGPIGHALRVRGELFGSEEDLRAAVDVLADSLMRVERARALLALGRRLRLDRRPTDAREPLREALALAARCGADGLAAEARTELGAAGARPRSDALAGPDALTPSEHRVAVLAADGRTNRDIAQELFVTPKTVEVHLSAVYRKLGIGSRRELTTALAA